LIVGFPRQSPIAGGLVVADLWYRVFQWMYERLYSVRGGVVVMTLGTQHVGWATATPTSGNWERGDRLFNSAAAVGQPKGWICTVAGAPGTWVSEGNL